MIIKLRVNSFRMQQIVFRTLKINKLKKIKRKRLYMIWNKKWQQLKSKDHSKTNKKIEQTEKRKQKQEKKRLNKNNNNNREF